MRRLDATMQVSGQIAPEDLAGIAAAGIRMIVNNRPDGEEPGQPPGAAIAAAARLAGIGYRHIAISSGFSAEQVAAMAAAIAQADGPVLAFCKSGTRSTFLWALARAQAGEPAEALERKAAAAGYDLSPIGPFLRR